MAALRDRGALRELSADDHLMVLRLLADRRDELSRSRAQGLNRLNRLMSELIPGGVPVKKSVPQYQTMLVGVRPRDPVRATLRRLAAEQLVDLVRLDTRLKALKAELKDEIVASGSHLMDLPGIGPAGAARILADVGDVRRFPDRNHFASWTGTAPVDASSGDHVRHRLSRGGNRQINRVLHIMATVQLRNATEGRAYFDRKKAGGKSSNEAMRCLKRRLSDAVYRVMVDDLAKTLRTDPGGQPGNDSVSSATGSQPNAGSSDKPLPGPVEQQPRTPLPAAS